MPKYLTRENYNLFIRLYTEKMNEGAGLSGRWAFPYLLSCRDPEGNVVWILPDENRLLVSDRSIFPDVYWDYTKQKSLGMFPDAYFSRLDNPSGFSGYSGSTFQHVDSHGPKGSQGEPGISDGAQNRSLNG